MAALVVNNPVLELDFGGADVVDLSPYLVAVDVASSAEILDVGTFANPYRQAVGRPQYGITCAFLWSEALYDILSPYVDTDIGFILVPDTTNHTNGSDITLAASLAADDIIDNAGDNGLAAGDIVQFTALTGGDGLVTDRHYYVISANLTATTFQVSATPGGAAVNFAANITAGTAVKVISPSIETTVRFGSLPFGRFEIGQKVEVDMTFAIVGDLVRSTT